MVWNRRTWMALAVLNAFCAVVMTAVALRLDDPFSQTLVRTGAAFQFMHSIATFACALFMNLGAHAARFSPALFLLGSAGFSASLYFRAAGVWSGGDIALAAGLALMAAGWGVLLIAARGIDHDV